MYTKMAGVSVKVILNCLLVGAAGMDIYGGPYAFIACYGIAMISNTYLFAETQRCAVLLSTGIYAPAPLL